MTYVYLAIFGIVTFVVLFLVEVTEAWIRDKQGQGL